MPYDIYERRVFGGEQLIIDTAVMEHGRRLLPTRCGISQLLLLLFHIQFDIIVIYLYSRYNDT